MRFLRQTVGRRSRIRVAVAGHNHIGIIVPFGAAALRTRRSRIEALVQFAIVGADVIVVANLVFVGIAQTERLQVVHVIVALGERVAKVI